MRKPARGKDKGERDTWVSNYIDPPRGGPAGDGSRFNGSYRASCSPYVLVSQILFASWIQD